MNINPTNNPMQYLNSGDEKSLSSDAGDNHNVAQKENNSSSQASDKQGHIQLSEQSLKIQQLKEAFKNSDGIDKEKVADVKSRLDAIKLDIQQTGPRLESASQRIADKIVEMDMLLAKK